MSMKVIELVADSNNEWTNTANEANVLLHYSLDSLHSPIRCPIRTFRMSCVLSMEKTNFRNLTTHHTTEHPA